MVQCGEHEPATESHKARTLLTPIISTPWVADITAGKDCSVFAGAELYACTYNGQTCIFLENTAISQAVCSKVLYDCHGREKLDGATPDANWDEFKKNLSDKVKIWSK